MSAGSKDMAFRPVRIAVLTVSDSRTLADDKSGDTLVERILGSRPRTCRPKNHQGRPGCDC